MTHANVGSLLVFDPSKVSVTDRQAAAQDKDAVVGIFTERGEGEKTPNSSPFFGTQNRIPRAT